MKNVGRQLTRGLERSYLTQNQAVPSLELSDVIHSILYWYMWDMWDETR